MTGLNPPPVGRRGMEARQARGGGLVLGILSFLPLITGRERVVEVRGWGWHVYILRMNRRELC